MATVVVVSVTPSPVTGGNVKQGKGAKRGPKVDPAAPHNKKTREIADKIENDGGTIIQNLSVTIRM